MEHIHMGVKTCSSKKCSGWVLAKRYVISSGIENLASVFESH